MAYARGQVIAIANTKGGVGKLQWASKQDIGAELVRLIAAELQTGELVWGKARQQR